jgi:hypothetical protein
MLDALQFYDKQVMAVTNIGRMRDYHANIFTHFSEAVSQKEYHRLHLTEKRPPCAVFFTLPFLRIYHHTPRMCTHNFTIFTKPLGNLHITSTCSQYAIDIIQSEKVER